MAEPVKRFKIDYASAHFEGKPYRYYTVSRQRVFKSWLFGTTHEAWQHLDTFNTREEAREFVETVRDLPEYL